MVVQEVDLVDIEAKDYLLGVTLLTRKTVYYLVIWGVNAKISRSMVDLVLWGVTRAWQGKSLGG